MASFEMWKQLHGGLDAEECFTEEGEDVDGGDGSRLQVQWLALVVLQQHKEEGGEW